MPWILIRLQIKSDWFLVYHRRRRSGDSGGGGGGGSIVVVPTIPTQYTGHRNRSLALLLIL
jgi:hypothetical protein